MALPIVGVLAAVGSSVATTVFAAALRMFTAKFVIKLCIKALDSWVVRTETKWDDKIWPDFKAALEAEIDSK